MIIEQKLQLFVSSRWRQIGIIGLIFLSSFGIYLGRYLRFNSWDLLNHPGSLLAQVFDRFSHPMEHPRTWGFTIFMGFFLSLIYFTSNYFQQSFKVKTAHSKLINNSEM
jgi:uncharacterized membrane protein